MLVNGVLVDLDLYLPQDSIFWCSSHAYLGQQIAPFKEQAAEFEIYHLLEVYLNYLDNQHDDVENVAK